MKRTVKLKGSPLALLGPEIKVGQKAPYYRDSDLNISLHRAMGKQFECLF